MNQIWQMWIGGISAPMIEDIITECESYPTQNANVGFDGQTKNDNLRRSEIRWIDRNKPSSHFIANTIWAYGEEANRNAFGFDISLIRDIQFTTYKEEDSGKYDWHFDTFWANPRTTDRKISVIIQLSDEDEYEGGDFELDSQFEQPQGLKKKGTVLVFPSFILHRVTPVTKGVRKSLVSWIEGPKFR